MKKVILAAAVLAMVGCAGRDANPVPLTKPTDDKMTCKDISIEQAAIQASVSQLVPQTDKTGKNAALGVGGLFLAGIPWFFMDLSKAEQIEVTAYQNRYNHLTTLASKKDCH